MYTQGNDPETYEMHKPNTSEGKPPAQEKENGDSFEKTDSTAGEGTRRSVWSRVDWKRILLFVAALLLCEGIWIAWSRNQRTQGEESTLTPGGVPAYQETETPSHRHNWQAAACEAPRTCVECGATEGTALGHQWVAATRNAPKTCAICAKTIGTAVQIPVTSCTMVSSSNEDGSTSDVAIGTWKDVSSKEYSGALRFWVMDKPGWSNMEYAVFQLDGKYETMEVTIAICKDSDANVDGLFRIYGDEVLIYTSDKVSSGSGARTFSLDVAGVKRLRIECETDCSKSVYCILDAALSLGK